MKKLSIRLHFLATSLTLFTAIAFASDLPTKNHPLLPIQSYQQTTDYTCGPAAAMSLMNFYHKLSSVQMTKATELKIAKEMGTSKETGTSQQQMVTWLEQHGFAVESGKNGSLDILRAQLNKGIPVLVDWIDWGGHWVVAVGYDKHTIYLADPAAEDDCTTPSKGITKFNIDRFASMWFDSDLTKGMYIIAVPLKASGL